MILYDGKGNQIASIDGDKPFAGKKWVVLGDSISKTNHSPMPYHAVISEKLGFTVENLAVGGITWEYVRDTEVPLISDDAALITIMAGTNDWTLYTNMSAGDADDTVSDGTYSGLVHDTLLAIQSRFPTIPVGVITPVYRAIEAGNATIRSISQTIKAVCEYNSVPCLDLNSGSGVLGFTAENIAYYYNDTGIHPNNNGQAVMAAKIEPFIRSLMP